MDHGRGASDTELAQAVTGLLRGLVSFVADNGPSLQSQRDQFLDGGAFRSSLHQAALDLGADVASLANQVYELLGSSSPFEGSWEVIPFVMQYLMDAVDRGDAGDVVSGVLAALRAPLRSFPFRVRLPASPYQLEFDIAGPQFLAVYSEDKEAQFPSVWIRGRVDACTEEGGLRSVERMLDTFMGAALAIGVMGFNIARGRRDGIIMAWLGEQEIPLAGTYADRIGASFFGIPEGLSDLEEASVAKEGIGAALERPLRGLRKVMAGEDARARDVRNACRLAANAVYSVDFGVLVTLAFSCLEGLLLPPKSKEDVVAKLAEAVAHLLGNNVKEKDTLRAQVKRLYDIRSQFVHTGKARETARAREEARALLFRVLRKEIAELEEPAQA